MMTTEEWNDKPPGRADQDLTAPEAVERRDETAEPGILPIPSPQQCVEDLRDDGFHPQATCVERLMREANYHQQELDGLVTRLRRWQARAEAAEAALEVERAALDEAHETIHDKEASADYWHKESRTQHHRAEALDAKLQEAAKTMLELADACEAYPPDIKRGDAALSSARAFLASTEGDKP